MEQTFNTSFERQINAAIEKVWQAWADASLWSSWVFMNMKTDFRVGGRYDNGKDEGGEYLEIVPMQKIKFTWEMKRYRPGSIIEIEFESTGQSTLCKLLHSNLQTLNDVHDAELGWNWALYSMQCFLETGKPVSWEAWENKMVLS